MTKVEDIYSRRRKTYEKLREKRSKSAGRVSNLRLAVFAAGIAAVTAMYATKYYILMTAFLIVWAVIFAYLILLHHKIIGSEKYAGILANINTDCLKRLKGDWKSFNDKGEEFSDKSHPFSGDIDIFGSGSLFQWINTACTYTGRQKLAWVLTHPFKDIPYIHKRQNAVRELSGKLAWRQRFMVQGTAVNTKVDMLEGLYSWAESVDTFYRKSLVISVIRFVPAFTILSGILYVMTDYMSWHIPVAGIALQFILLKYKSRERGTVFATVEKYKNAVRAYENMLKYFENTRFKSEYICSLQKKLIDGKGNTAFKQVNKITNIWNSISSRYNAFHIFFNILTLWDYQCLIALEEWKENSGRNLRQWLDVIGEVETLASLSVICYDNPEWIMPEIVEGSVQMLESKSIGHPLLGKDRVYNDMSINMNIKVLLITGSNMSGKSTFLRTAGINLLLAYVGAPVCADYFKCSVMDIYTCMRTSDNLEQSISSFYAELLRIKMILDSAREGKTIFFLLDEIFKGTNSTDRHTGAKMLIQNLLKQGAAGMVSTHDLELASMEKENGNEIKNYHFREYYRDNNIYFDYKLRSGVSNTRNAMYLMRMAGIDLSADE